MNRQTRLRSISRKAHDMHKVCRRISSLFPYLNEHRGMKFRKLTLFNALVKSGEIKNYLNSKVGMTGGHNV